LPAEPDRAILSNVWTTSTCYKPLEIERPLAANGLIGINSIASRSAG
jgi:hypothetical protein